MTKQEIYPQRPMRFRDWWYQKKSQFYASEWVRISLRVSAIVTHITKRRRGHFQLMSGFVDTQILLAFVRTGALDKLRDRPKSIAQLASLIGIDAELRGFCVVLGRRLALSSFEKIRFQSHVAEF